MNAKPHLSPRAWLEDEILELLNRHGLLVSHLDEGEDFVEIFATDPERGVSFNICLRSDENLDDPDLEEEDEE